MIETRLDEPRARRLREARERLACAWQCHDDGDALAEAAATLCARSEVVLCDWNNRGDRTPVPFASTSGSAFGSTPWTCEGIAQRYVNDSWLARRLNEAVFVDELARISPEGYDAFRRYFLRPLGFSSQLRVNLDDGSGNVAFCGLYRGEDDAPFEEADRLALQALVPDLVQYVNLRRRFEREASVEPVLTHVVEAMHQSAFLVTDRGKIVYANPYARRAHRSAPEWLGTREWLRTRPDWVHVVPLRFSDGARLYLVLVDEARIPVEHAHETSWATRWRLSPRHARVARLMVSGMCDKEIAGELDLSFHTIRTYARQLYRAAGVHSRGELARVIRDAEEGRS